MSIYNTTFQTDELGKATIVGAIDKSFIIKLEGFETLEIINKYLKENPSYPIMVDNGRYLFYFIGDDIKKHAFVCGGFSEVDDLYIYGSIK